MRDATDRKIKAVLFDYGMVLCDTPDAGLWRQMADILGISGQRLQAVYWKHREDYDRGVLSGRAYWMRIAQEIGRSADDETLSGLMETDIALWTKPNQPMIEWARRLQRAGVKTGILSNLGDAMEAGIRARFPWLNEFAHHTFSHGLGITKPDAAIYRHAAEGLCVSPAEVLFVDDKEENIRAAQSAGMSAVQYSDQASFVQAMERLGLSDLFEC